ncbi:hypothetical protein ABIA33_007686 [Streptacidiphilus sp. MAP12-16]
MAGGPRAGPGAAVRGYWCACSHRRCSSSPAESTRRRRSQRRSSYACPPPRGGRAEELLLSLQRCHLVESPSWGRWRMHDLVRLYADDHGRHHAKDDRREALRAGGGTGCGRSAGSSSSRCAGGPARRGSPAAESGTGPVGPTNSQTRSRGTRPTSSPSFCCSAHSPAPGPWSPDSSSPGVDAVGLTGGPRGSVQTLGLVPFAVGVLAGFSGSGTDSVSRRQPGGWPQGRQHQAGYLPGGRTEDFLG